MAPLTALLPEHRATLKVILPLCSTLQIRSAGGQQSPYYADLEAAQTKAEEAGLGLWSKVIA